MSALFPKVSRSVLPESDARGVIETYYMTWREKPRERCDGWYIQIPYSREGQKVVWRKLVSKARYGGTKTSLKRIALAVRDRLMRKLRVHDPGLGIYQRKKSRRNTSGFVGVRLTEEGFKGSGYWHWEARWMRADGGVSRKTFSVTLYGSERAKRLAIAARENALKERGQAAMEKQCFYVGS